MPSRSLYCGTKIAEPAAADQAVHAAAKMERVGAPRGGQGPADFDRRKRRLRGLLPGPAAGLPAVGNESDAPGYCAAFKRALHGSERALSRTGYSDDVL